MSGPNKGGPWRTKSWSRVYRNRMDQGLEQCRLCLSRTDLTFDHIRPLGLRGSSGMHNITILCRPCNVRKGDRMLRGLRSLTAEEAAAPPDRRWSELAQVWDPEWTPPDCPARIYVVNGSGCVPTLRCNLTADHDGWHWDDEIGLWGGDAMAEGGTRCPGEAHKSRVSSRHLGTSSPTGSKRI